ncbi:hypothetical protein BDZ89DRAFT_1131235 [Hymenopellis radicata]|nr:hypothetical protein BDZ89DRAFT_1131235 [Hymenopellis radicata]
MPGSVHIKRSNEVHLEVYNYATILGIIFGALLGYGDEGVVGVDICFGGGSEDGSIDLVVDLTSKKNLPPSMGLRVELSNPVVLPLATWFVKKQVEVMLEGVIKAAVEEIGSFAHVVAVETEENKKSMWGAITHAIEMLLPESNDETRVEPTVSLRGVQMDIVAEGEEPDTTAALAVGVVPQLLSAKGEPAPLESPSGVYERAVYEIPAVEERVVERLGRLGRVWVRSERRWMMHLRGWGVKWRRMNGYVGGGVMPLILHD